MTDHNQTSRPKVLGRVLGWLRAGYPQGIPQSDYVALFAVLHRHLTDYEVAAVAQELAAGNPDSEISHEDIVAAIARIAKEQPDEHDVARVAAQLEAGGWALAEPLTDDD
ncbi:DUF3349 domain-containing protein [Nocardia bhagyanarayanae]|uniref:Uncharacterized protein DUF3349 n=1 Tax=Nocardia bhagyanarayanae TaxID=1215925 RepID=A0A543F8K0_9NOCA|nr:DUF3349 domain-containing protein [Nocardia bhagyanarayanae]TQM30131.1 uncharacterized protein DUF3349 [Nocardia bhagyanarayanae]